MITERLDFQQIKASVSMEQVFYTYHLRFHRSGPGALRGRCPLPMHQSKQSRWSFSADLHSDLWACHSESCIQARNSRIGGDVFDFVALMEDCSIRDAALKLQQRFSVCDSSNLPPRIEALEKNEKTLKPLSFKLTNINPSHGYVEKRGITSATASDFGIGFYYGTGYFSGRIVIPIHDDSGQLVAYAGRAVDVSFPKYRLPRGFPKSSVLFNLHRVQESSVVIILEGFFDCMMVWQAGFQNVVSLMGSSLSNVQQKLITDRFRAAVLMLDADAAGEKATAKILESLSPYIYVRVVNLPQGKQPDQLSTEEIQNHLSFLR